MDLSEEQFTRELGGGFPSLRATLAHMVGAERIWLMRWKGQASSKPTWMESATAALLREKLTEIESERREFLRRLTDADLERPLSYRFLSGQESCHLLGDLLLHVANHATYHRGQAASMLRQVGTAPPTTDMLFFVKPGGG